MNEEQNKLTDEEWIQKINEIPIDRLTELVKTSKSMRKHIYKAYKLIKKIKFHSKCAREYNYHFISDCEKIITTLMLTQIKEGDR